MLADMVTDGVMGSPGSATKPEVPHLSTLVLDELLGSPSERRITCGVVADEVVRRAADLWYPVEHFLVGCREDGDGLLAGYGVFSSAAY